MCSVRTKEKIKRKKVIKTVKKIRIKKTGKSLETKQLEQMILSRISELKTKKSNFDGSHE